MTYEVVVVGGGIGGLTVAALLAARGVSVCLLERESRVGGCAASFEKFGYSFEQGLGIYPLWEPGEIHDRIFNELPVEAPETRSADPAYLVRLPDGSEVPFTTDPQQFDAALTTTFPECADQAIRFYRETAALSDSLRRALMRVPDLRTASSLKQMHTLLRDVRMATRIMRSQRETVVEHLQGCSARFRRFIDLQLQTLAQAVSDECNYLYASLVLSIPRQGTSSIRGGTAALAETLADSIKRSGGTTRLNTAVLRLAYDTTGAAIGVDLLSGETVNASRAIISNLTVWDTYGKLIGLKHIEPEVRNLLGRLRGWGVYLLYLAMKEAATHRLPAHRIFALTDWLDDQPYDPETVQLTFAAAPEWDAGAPAGQRAITVQTFTRADDWFTFQENESDHEEKDQRMLENCWQRLHSAIPELGADIEVIDTATPRTFYEQTRRRFGMVGGVGQSQGFLGPTSISHRTSLPNVFMVGDTTFPGVGIAAVSHSALIVANHLTA